MPLNLRVRNGSISFSKAVYKTLPGHRLGPSRVTLPLARNACLKLEQKLSCSVLFSCFILLYSIANTGSMAHKKNFKSLHK